MEEQFAKYFSGNASQNEESQMKKWRNESKKNSEEFLDYASSWYASFDSKVDTSNAFLNIMSNVESENQFSEPSKSIFPSYLKYAAVLIIGFGITWFGINYEETSKVAFQTLEKQTQEVNLLDGSKVFLSENSSITYLNDFEGNTREVLLSGRAFFDVKRDETKPFIVRTDNSEIKVLGTSFLVDSHIEKFTEVIVKSGKVSVTKISAIDANIIELDPGEMGSVKENQFKKTVNDNPNYLAWQNKILEFKRSEMTEVVKLLEDVYFVDIELSDENIKNCALTAKFDHREIDTVLEIISQTFGMSLEQKSKDKFILSGTGCSAN